LNFCSELAFVANRKNTDEHIMLFAWSHVDGQVSVVHIERDKLIPRVEYQGSIFVLTLNLCKYDTHMEEVQIIGPLDDCLISK